MRPGQGWGGRVELYNIPGGNSVGRAGGAAVERGLAVAEQPGRGAAGQLGGGFGEKAVEPVVRSLGDGSAQADGVLLNSWAATSSTTPTEIALSATLKTGHQCTVKKSVTEPWSTRSKPLPTVPPRTRPSIVSV